MKYFLIIAISLFPLALSPSNLQVTQDTQVQDPFLVQLKRKAEEEAFTKYDLETTNILNKINQITIYDQLVEEIDLKLNNAATFGRISVLLNPSDPTLTGKSYNDYLYEEAEKIFVTNRWNGEKKENEVRIKSILKNLTSQETNPIGSSIGNVISGFVNSNPILGVASKVISGISTFFVSASNNSRVKSIKETIAKEQIEEFQNAIKEYVEFYDKALMINKSFNSQIQAVKVKSIKENEYARQINLLLVEKVEQVFGNSDISISDIQSQFPYDFEQFYLENESDDYYTLVELSAQIDAQYSKVIGYSTQAQTLMDNYFSNIEDLMNSFQDRLQVDDAGIDFQDLRAAVNSSDTGLAKIDVDFYKNIFESNQFEYFATTMKQSSLASYMLQDMRSYDRLELGNEGLPAYSLVSRNEVGPRAIEVDLWLLLTIVAMFLVLQIYIIWKIKS